MKKTIIAIAFIIIAIVITIVIYNSNNQDKEVIKIGFPVPLTGDAASWGIPVKKGAEIALERINEEGINGRKVELIFEDSMCDGKTAATIVNKFINVDKVSNIIGSVCSSVTLAMAPITEEKKMLLLASGSSAPAIRDAGDYVFSIYPLDDSEAGFIADFIFTNLSKKTVAILYANNDYGVGGKNVFKKAFEQKGGEVKVIESYLTDAKDFRSQLSKIKNAEVEVLFIWGQPGEMVSILGQIGELGIKIPILTSSVVIETDDLKKAGLELANGVIYTSLKEGLANDNSNYLNEKYNEKYNEDASLLSKLGYDVVKLTAEAMRDVGTDSTSLKDYLHLVKDFPGASGIMSFDKDGTVIKDFELKTVKDGKLILYLE